MAEEERLLALFDCNWFGFETGQRRVQQRCTIPSDRLALETKEMTIRQPTEKKARKRGKSKSFSELQFEELKGFLDLGFTFSEWESDQRLLSLVPGLQKLGQQSNGLSEEEEAGNGSVCRPYLSESWVCSAVDDRRNLALQRRLKSWKIPVHSDATDMKLHLRQWAHNVASSFR